jgi:hypothetical protein
MLAATERRMMVAISLVRAVPGQEKSVYCAIKGSHGVARLNHVFRDHDFLLMLKAERISLLAQYMAEVREIKNVSSVDLVLIGGEGCLEEERLTAVLVQ